ncbi:MAG: hypothetical protein ACO2ZE_10645 [Pseudohongiellaceae bacterium]
MRPKTIGKVVQFMIGGDVAEESVVFGSRIEQESDVLSLEVLVKSEGQNWWIPLSTIQPAKCDTASCIRWKA